MGKSFKRKEKIFSFFFKIFLFKRNLLSCDNYMNLNLNDVVCTSRDADQFWKIESIYIRGIQIKYLCIPQEVIALVKEEGAGADSEAGGRGRGRGRGDYKNRNDNKRGRNDGVKGRGRGRGN